MFVLPLIMPWVMPHPINKPITDTHMVEGLNNLSVGIVSVERAVIGVGIIGQGITQGVINGSTNIGSNIITDILTDHRKQLFKKNTFQLNSLQSETLVIGPQDKSVKRTNRIISMPIDSRNISGNRISRIDTPGVNKYIWGVIDTTSNMMSGTDNIKKFDTIVQSSTNQERNMESSCIEEESLKSIFPELGTNFDSSVRFPKFKRLGHSSLPDRRTVTGCGGARTGMIWFWNYERNDSLM